uniref:Trans-1,2-dihydrobenzene-1,2-diol dehydrogenase n=1 Tax=Parasteatoda tepidariorum TaxID=114398 RepID=A0A2L2Y1H3_PARTP
MATKWGVVSAGKISHDFVTAVQSMPKGDHEFIAVAARNLSSAKEFASSHDIPKAYGSYEELAKDSDIEVVYVGTIASHHYAVGKLMLESGKHVLMEKPMTLNAKQTKNLIEIARKQKRFLMEALWSRFFPAYKFFMDLIKSGKIGDVVHISANIGKNLLKKERLMKKDQGGGSILDLGVYTLNAVTMIYGGDKPTKVAAVGHLSEEGVDIMQSTSLLYTKNRTANVTSTLLAPCDNELVIIGTKGIIKVKNPFWCPTAVETAEKTHEFPLPDAIRPFNCTNSSGLRYEAMEVRECLQKGKLESSILPLKDSETHAELMDEIRHQIGFYFDED